MGSGKITLGRLIKRLFDPTAPETVRLDPRDFLQKAAHSYVVMLDNQNSLPEWAADTLCRLVTGESDSKRALYTDDEDAIVGMLRAVILNGINTPSDRPDVQDRTLPIELERIPDKDRRDPKGSSGQSSIRSTGGYWGPRSMPSPPLSAYTKPLPSGTFRDWQTGENTQPPHMSISAGAWGSSARIG